MCEINLFMQTSDLKIEVAESWYSKTSIFGQQGDKLVEVDKNMQ